MKKKNADNKKRKRNITRNADGKIIIIIIIINKQTNKGKKSFFQVAVTFLYPSLTSRT